MDRGLLSSDRLEGFVKDAHIFLLIADNLSRALGEAKRVNKIQGVLISQTKRITHLLFVDDVLIFFLCVELEGRILKEILEELCEATSMMINNTKSAMYIPEVGEGTRQRVSGIFNFSIDYLLDVFKYLGFMFKPNNCSASNWKWILLHIEKKSIVGAIVGCPVVVHWY
jgi:hypothetical protein